MKGAQPSWNIGITITTFSQPLSQCTSFAYVYGYMLHILFTMVIKMSLCIFLCTQKPHFPILLSEINPSPPFHIPNPPTHAYSSPHSCLHPPHRLPMSLLHPRPTGPPPRIHLPLRVPFRDRRLLVLDVAAPFLDQEVGATVMETLVLFEVSGGAEVEWGGRGG